MIYSESLTKYPEIFHGFTTRDGSEQEFESLVLPRQVHGNKISQVTRKDLGKKINGVDGLVTKVHGIKLGVRTADCLPILFYEPVKKIIGVAHAGWRGALGQIAQKMIIKIKALGGVPQNIAVVMGPHICGSCYTIPEARARLFTGEAIWQRDGEFHLDLALFNLKQLLSSGANKKNIEILPYCTSCQNNLFFSFRKNRGKDYGEMLAVIGLI